MRYKKILCLSFILALLVSVFPVANAQAAHKDTYATIITASDFQGGADAFPNFGEMLSVIKNAGYASPDAFFFGGDYGDDSGVDPTLSTELVMEQVLSVYPETTRGNTIYVQGNHDADDPSGEYLTPTGFYEFESFVVYSINEDSYNAKQSSREEYDQVVQALGADIEEKLRQMVASEDTRPVFVTTHVPLHHSSRRSYGDTLYSKYLFDVLNEMGQQLDIVFLFGHNHSSSYDDDIGGAVNYLPRGSEIRIPIPNLDRQGMDGYTVETLNFTYMNYGYVGYSRNTDNSVSTSTLTTGVIELSPAAIEISRYSKDGLYCTETICRVNPQTEEPYVSLAGEESGIAGESGVVFSRIANIENPVYIWSSSDPDVATVLPAERSAQLVYKKEGTAEINLQITGADGAKASTGYTVTVSASTAGAPMAAIYQGNDNVTGSSLRYYSIRPGEKLYLTGSFTGFGTNSEALQVKWSSSDPKVAAVANGLVTFRSGGTATITFTVTDGNRTLHKSVNLTVSTYAPTTYVYRLTDTLEEGKIYMIASTDSLGTAYIMSGCSIAGTSEKQRLMAELADIRPVGSEITLLSQQDNLQWKAVAGTDASGTEGLFLQNADGAYLRCLSSGLYTESSMRAGEGMLWTLNEEHRLVSGSGYGPTYSSDRNFHSDDAPEKCYIYELVAVMSYTQSSFSEDASPQAPAPSASAEPSLPPVSIVKPTVACKDEARYALFFFALIWPLIAQ